MGITTSEYFLVFCPLSSQMIPQEMNLDCLQISQNKTTTKGGAMGKVINPLHSSFFPQGWAGGGLQVPQDFNQNSQCNCRNPSRKCPIIFWKFCTFMTSFLTEKNMGFYLILASKEKKMLLPNRRHFGTLRKTLLLEVKALFSNTPYGSLFTPCEKLKGRE